MVLKEILHELRAIRKELQAIRSSMEPFHKDESGECALNAKKTVYQMRLIWGDT